MLQGLDRIRAVLPVRSLAEFIDPAAGESAPVGVVLPPHVEPSQLVEAWEARDYLADRFGRGARIGNVVTLVGSDFASDQLVSADPISARGWGRHAGDVRAVADISVGQIESASHLLLVGTPSAYETSGELLEALNPRASRLFLEDASDAALWDFLSSARPSHPGRPSDSARALPPWLELLEADSAPLCGPDRFLYRRTRPFDPTRFSEWLSTPPPSLLRAKGKIWIANRFDEALGYSCAGPVHRVFPVGRWWAGLGNAAWPTCESDRHRLLERWHPQFGDRRQEIALVGADLDHQAISASLDSCLLSQEEAIAAGQRDEPTEPNAHPEPPHTLN